MERLAWRLIDGGGFRAKLRRTAGGFISRMFPGPFDAEVDGLKFRLYPGENYDDRKILAHARLPEQSEHVLFGGLLRPGTVFVDIGANVGTYALFAARRGARVLAIEVALATAEKLTFNIAANGAGDGASTGNGLGAIDVAHTAVGEEPGQLTLWFSGTDCGFVTFAGEFADGQAGIWTATEVPVRPLADVLHEAGIVRPDVMKIDVEGFEDRVLMALSGGDAAGAMAARGVDGNELQRGLKVGPARDPDGTWLCGRRRDG
ncbi:FkbM family methyltransferase [Breoghania sp.]|uniref:FkbM family methyltransferase n=1 Tax=Breoghania sp. TaxID=2065378 RepID=UPI00262E6482|nr:FkbM family methyltransferase [Breoghania sp.]MDJ0931084.1 FkbM family methyltransferase [Breoghania sp.]